MIVGVVGYGCSGASACVDFLKELDVFSYLPNSSEFQLLKISDGLIDLHYHLVTDTRYLSQNTAIRRFLRLYKNPGLASINKLTKGKFKEMLHEYIDSLNVISWKGRSSLDPNDIRKRNDSAFFSRINACINWVLKLFSHRFHFPCYQDRYYTKLTHEEFCEKTKVFISKLLLKMGFDTNKDILLEQIVDASCPEIGIDYFNKCKVIVVDRDPKDVYLLKNYIYKNSPAFIPTNSSVSEFVRFFLMQHKTKSNNPNVLYINFEDLIYKYEDTTQRICSFLNINKLNKNRFRHFNPSNSIANTNLSIKFPQFSSELGEIENNLKMFLYDYESAPKIDSNGLKPFNENKKNEKKD